MDILTTTPPSHRKYCYRACFRQVRSTSWVSNPRLHRAGELGLQYGKFTPKCIRALFANFCSIFCFSLPSVLWRCWLVLHKNPESRRWGNAAWTQHSPMLRQKAECFFWYRPTRVVPEQRPLNGCCCCCFSVFLFLTLNMCRSLFPLVPMFDTSVNRRTYFQLSRLWLPGAGLLVKPETFNTKSSAVADKPPGACARHSVLSRAALWWMTAIYWPDFPTFIYPSPICRLRWEGFARALGFTFGTGKLEWRRYNLVKVGWWSTQPFGHNTLTGQTHTPTATSP